MTPLVALLVGALLQGGAAMRTIDRGDQSHVEEPTQATARTAAEWSALWRQHAPDRAAPAVDLSKEMVVALFMGSRNTAGYRIEVVSAREEQGALVIHYRQTEPARDAITAQIITSPYHIVAVPASTLPVRFQREQ